MKILVIAPRFYGFDVEIFSQLRSFFLDRFIFSEKPIFKSGFVQLFFQKLPKFFYQKIFNSYVQKILSNVEYADVVLMVRIELWRYEHLTAMRLKYPKARFLLYQWDASENLPNLMEQLPFFDRVYTFNPVDADKLGLIAKSLFYKDSWRKAIVASGSFSHKYKVAFIGTDHSDRHPFIQRFKQVNGIDDADFFCHLYRSRWSFYFNKYLKGGGNLSTDHYDFKSFPLGEPDSINAFLMSRAILDINPESQVGLSARTFEALALGKKLITTNEHIKDYDFYHPDNVFIVDRDNPVVPHEFFCRDYVPPEDSVLKRYSSSEWVKEFLI